jgi:hypothetical protein
MKNKDLEKWHQFETVVNKILDLKASAGSGNKWHQKADGFDNFLMADAKTTQKNSFILKNDFLKRYTKLALLEGKSFVLPIRFIGNDGTSDGDYVVVPLNDYVENYLQAKNKNASSGK